MTEALLVSGLLFALLASRWALPILFFLLVGPNPGRGVQNALGTAWG